MPIPKFKLKRAEWTLALPYNVLTLQRCWVLLFLTHIKSRAWKETLAMSPQQRNANLPLGLLYCLWQNSLLIWNHLGLRGKIIWVSQTTYKYESPVRALSSVGIVPVSWFALIHLYAMIGKVKFWDFGEISSKSTSKKPNKQHWKLWYAHTRISTIRYCHSMLWESSWWIPI